MALLLIGSGALAYVAYVNSRPTPTKALDAFCTALQSRDYQAAYTQLSSRFQNKTPEPLFAGFFANVKSCTYDTVMQADNRATATLTTSVPGQTRSDQVTLVQDNNGAWKIDDEANLSGLTKMLDTYCNALQQGDYPTAYSQLSGTMQSKMSASQMASFFPKVASCRYDSLSTTAGGATINVITVSTSGQTETNLASLVHESGGDWKIDDLTNLPDKTLDTFCTALQNKDYQTAYDQLSVALQGGFPESKFASMFSAVTSCTHDAATASGGNVTANMTLGFGQGQTLPLMAFLIKDSNGKWKIDNLVNLPNQTLDTFCTALQNKDYQTAYDQLSVGAQQLGSEQQFANAFSSVTTCTHTFPTQSGDTATATMTFGTSAGQTVNDKVILIKENNGDWKINSLQTIQ